MHYFKHIGLHVESHVNFTTNKMASVEGNGFKLEAAIGAKISGFRKEYDNDRDSRDDYGRLKNICQYII